MIDLFLSTKRVSIGIDPGESTTGVAIYNHTDERWEQLKTMKVWDAISFISELRSIRTETRSDGTVDGAVLIIENPGLNKPVFPIPSETNLFKGAITRRDYKTHQKALAMFSRRAQNIGMNKQLAKMFIEYCRRLGFRVIEERPGKSKVNAEDFRKLTGWEGKGSQHARDAACLILGYK